jgi:hypothetical protein
MQSEKPFTVAKQLDTLAKLLDRRASGKKQKPDKRQKSGNLARQFEAGEHDDE